MTKKRLFMEHMRVIWTREKKRVYARPLKIQGRALSCVLLSSSTERRRVEHSKPNSTF